MNHIYHSIWNEALGARVAVSEISKGQVSANRRKILATSLLICSTPTWALPTGDQLVAGQAAISTPNANVMQIDQTSQKAVVNWQSFSVGQNEAVNIQQPNAQAALLNRVVGADASQIQGRINGQVYLVNPNGVVFGKTAQVDVGGLVATTHNISNADFIAGKNHFTQDGATKIKADGGKGKVVVWSETQTDYNGSISANKAGEIEVSSKGLLNYAGRADAGVANYALIDPRAAAGNGFGANGIGQTMTFNPSTLAATLALGANIVLQANNDITLDADINVSGSKGGILTLKAGRNIILNGKINTANGNFSAIAGDPYALASDRDAGTPTITLGAGASINTGIGRVILAAISGNFINNTGSTTPITASRWQVYSTDPRLNQRNGMVADSKQYGQAYSGLIPVTNTTALNIGGIADQWVQSYADTGNWFLYSITPVLTITPNLQAIAYGTNPVDVTYTLTGFLDDDTYDTAGIYGSALFEIGHLQANQGVIIFNI